MVNQAFLDYFTKRIEVFRNGMINGPTRAELNKMDTLIIALALEVAIREGMMIEEEVEEGQEQPEVEVKREAMEEEVEAE